MSVFLIAVGTVLMATFAVPALLNKSYRRQFDTPEGFVVGCGLALIVAGALI